MKRPTDLKYTGIEAVFRSHRRMTDERFVQIDQAGLVKWAREDTVRIWQAVALHSFLDPDAFDAEPYRAGEYLKKLSTELAASSAEPVTLLDKAKVQFVANLKAACDAVIVHELDLAYHAGMVFDLNSQVELSKFHAWTIRADLPVAEGWPARTAGTTERWSWGRHTTPLLEALEAAAKAHWRRLDEGGQYDPADPSSVSNNDKVAAWLQERFPVVSKETAQVMARILRDPNLPVGRPRER